MLTRVPIKSALLFSPVFLAAAGLTHAADIGNTTDSFNNFNNIRNNITDLANNAMKVTNGAISFDMVVSQGAHNCLPYATAHISIVSSGTAEDMFISATGLPPSVLRFSQVI